MLPPGPPDGPPERRAERWSDGRPARPTAHYSCTTVPNRSLIGFHFFECSQAAGKGITQLKAKFFPLA